MRVRRAEILPLAEEAIRNALREAVREALRDVGLSPTPQVTSEKPDAIPARIRDTRKAPGNGNEFGALSDEEAWERFDSIRFARIAGMSHQQAS